MAPDGISRFAYEKKEKAATILTPYATRAELDHAWPRPQFLLPMPIGQNSFSHNIVCKYREKGKVLWVDLPYHRVLIDTKIKEDLLL